MSGFCGSFVREMNQVHHPIKVATRLTGLSAHVIRIWEQRYRAVEPARTATNRRLYSSADIERLRLLRGATQSGHNIGQVAGLSDAELRILGDPVAMAAPAPARPTPADDAFIDAVRDDCLTAIRALDGPGLGDLLNHATTTLGAQGTLLRLIAPLVQTLGTLWRDGSITAAHEHFASEVLRSFLSRLAKPFGGSHPGPVLVVATPAGQIHEMGALIVGALAANLGWQVTSLGVSLPALEIAGAARQKQARAVALSLVYPEDDPALPLELETLRRYLPATTALLAGGRATSAYRPALIAVGAILLDDLAQIGPALDRLRAAGQPQAS